MTELFRLGVNYWPRRKAMQWWSRFDPGEVREEFDLIRQLGLGVVRIFLLWDDFQPEPDAVSRRALEDLTTVCDLAREAALEIEVTFFTGHMSGPNWSPRWLLGGPLPDHEWIHEVVSMGRLVTGGYRNMFHDPAAIEAERRLLRTVVGALCQHPAIWMWSLGNEPDLFAHPQDAASGRGWVRAMAGLIHDLDPAHPVTCGLHTDSLQRDNGFRVHDVFAETDVAVMHAYPMYAPWARQPLDPDFVPFTCALTAALCGKPVLMEEFGGCTAPPGGSSSYLEWKSHGRPRRQFMASEEELAEFLRATLARLHRIGATGALVWCFADYAPDLWDQPPCREARHERFFGLVRPDGSLKPHAQVLADFAAERRAVQPIPESARLSVAPEAFYADPAHHLSMLYPEYLSRQET